MSKRQDKAAEPRRRDPERRRREIVEAAARIVAEQGSAALTHRAVVARAGIALGTMTRHFPSIDDLREAALTHLGDETESALDEVERELATSDDPVTRFAVLMHDYLLDHRQIASNLALITAAITDESLRSLELRWNDRLTDLLADTVGREQARAMVVYLDGVMIHAALHDEPFSLNTITSVLRSITAMPSPQPESTPERK